jgi:hypothetical protein
MASKAAHVEQSMPSTDDVRDASFKLESALTNIHGLASALMVLGENGYNRECELFAYLGGMLSDHEKAAAGAVAIINTAGRETEGAQ